VIWFQYMQVTSCWGDHDSSTRKQHMIGLEIGKTITHISFTPKHVYGDQIKLKRNIMTWVENIEVGKR